MVSTLSYKLNQYLTLKLERGNTEIYINNQPFRQCKFLLINIPKESIHRFDNINSIDEAAEVSTESIESFKAKIDPETEFWGHCSNLQAWAENQYDTRLLHRTIAFPLLKKLTEVGDPVAKKVFKEEIASRFINGNYTVITFLIKEGYLNNLNKEELDTLIHEFDFTKIQWNNSFEYVEFLVTLANMGSQDAQKKYNDYLIYLFLNENLERNSPIFRYLKEVPIERLEDAINHLEFEKYRTDLWVLKEIANLKIEKGIAIFKEEIIKKVSSADLSEIGLIFEDNLLTLFTSEELKLIFNKFDPNIISTLETDKALDLFSKLIDIYQQEKLPNYDLLKNIFEETILQKIKKLNFEDAYRWVSEDVFSNHPSELFNLFINQDIESLAKIMFQDYDYRNRFIKSLKNSETFDVPFSSPYKFIKLFLKKGLKSSIDFFNSVATQRLKEASLTEIAFLGRDGYINYFNEDTISVFNLENDHILSILSNGYLLEKEYALVLITLKRMALKGDTSAFYILTEIIQQLYDNNSINLKHFLKSEGYIQLVENEMKIVNPNESIQITENQKQEIREKYMKYFEPSLNKELINILEIKNDLYYKFHRIQQSNYDTRYLDLPDFLLEGVQKLSPENKEKVEKFFVNLIFKKKKTSRYRNYGKDFVKKREFAALYLGYLHDKYKSKSPDTIKAMIEEEQTKKSLEQTKKSLNNIESKLDISALKFNSYIQNFNLKDLKTICRQFGVKEYSQYRKQELISKILSTVDKEQLEKIFIKAQKNIISPVIDLSIEIIRGDAKEKIVKLFIDDSDPSKIDLSFKGKNWDVSTTINFSIEDINQLHYRCNCGQGNNLGYCSHFWVGLLYLVKQKGFDLSKWNLTPLPERLTEKIYTLNFNP